MRSTIARVGLPILAFVAVISVWAGADVALGIQEIVLPNPAEIFNSMVENKELLLRHTGVTMLEAMIGFVAGTLLGCLAAILFTYFPLLKRAFYPYVIGIKATPVYALGPLLVLWFGNGIWSKAAIAMLVAFFPVLVAAVKGLGSVDSHYRDLFRSLGAGRTQEFLKLRVPCALPYVFPALKVATTFSVVGATIGEFVGASAGIGHLIVNASYYLDTSLMFAGIVAISIGGYLFFLAMEKIEKKVVFWQEG